MNQSRKAETLHERHNAVHSDVAAHIAQMQGEFDTALRNYRSAFTSYEGRQHDPSAIENFKKYQYELFIAQQKLLVAKKTRHDLDSKKEIWEHDIHAYPADKVAFSESALDAMLGSKQSMLNRHALLTQMQDYEKFKPHAEKSFIASHMQDHLIQGQGAIAALDDMKLAKERYKGMYVNSVGSTLPHLYANRSHIPDVKAYSEKIRRNDRMQLGYLQELLGYHQIAI
jgi:hypothetical protein